MPDLPQELVDRLVDESFDTIEHLKNLSLVAKPWLHRARYHLFRSITLAPKDRKEIENYYTYLKQQALPSYNRSSRFYNPLSPTDQKFLRSSSSRNSESQTSILSSSPAILPHVRTLRLESSIRTGGGRKILAEDYFDRYLGFGDNPDDSYLMRDVSYDAEEFYLKQMDRWYDIDLPWGHLHGIQALPFRNLRSVYIQWSLFSWTLPLVDDYEPLYFDESPLSTDPMWQDHSPGYQLAMFLKSCADTLDHVFIDEYPGFCLAQYTSTHNADALLDLIIQNSPNTKSLCLGGLYTPHTSASFDEATNLVPNHHNIVDPPSEPLTKRNPPIYPSGEEIPYVSSEVFGSIYTCRDGHLSQRVISVSLERLFLRGFDEESSLLIEDALFNSDMISLQKITHLALSAMPATFDYAFLFSKLRHTLTHLTLDIDESTHSLKLRFSYFPSLEHLQFISYSVLYHSSLNSILSSLSDASQRGSGRTLKSLHLGFSNALRDSPVPSIENYLQVSEADTYLPNMLRTSSIQDGVKFAVVTMNMSQGDFARLLPNTFATGCLRVEETDRWWM
ncbi:hypothetical protein C8R42DRAFT_727769 [Lentinula raphanica]|nr:hypothetical protein C8R42DRAFT_727769 [Lentinula raphanica]